MANIMDSLFGPTPYDVGQQRNQQDMSYAEKVARMGGFEQAKFGIGQGAAGMTRAGAGMMGMVDPLQQEAQMREQVMGMGGDLTTSAGLKAKAMQFAQAGDQRTAMKLAIAAKEAEAREQAMIVEAQKQALSERKQNFNENEAFELKKREAEARIQQNQQRIDDARTSAADRAALLRENNQIKLLLGQAMIESRRAAAEVKASQPKPISRIDAMSIDKSLAASSGANGAMQLLDQADALYGKYASGRDEPILGGAARWGAAVGLADPKRAADYEVAGQIAKDLGVIKLGLIGGSDTERELQVAIDTSPSPDKLPSTNRTIIANQRRAIQVLQAEPDFKTEWVNKNGSLSKLDKETGDTYGKAWRKYQQANFNPVVNPGAAGTTSPATQSNADKIPTGVPTGRTFKVLGKEPQ